MLRRLSCVVVIALCGCGLIQGDEDVCPAGSDEVKTFLLDTSLESDPDSTEVLENVPIAVLLDNFDSDFLLDFSDAVVVDSDGEPLAFELETPSETSAFFDDDGVAWVVIPELEVNRDDQFFRVFSGGDGPSAEQPDAVWGPEFAAVWHTGEIDPLELFDSTGNENNAVAPDDARIGFSFNALLASAVEAQALQVVAPTGFAAGPSETLVGGDSATYEAMVFWDNRDVGDAVVTELLATRAAPGEPDGLRVLLPAPGVGGRALVEVHHGASAGDPRVVRLEASTGIETAWMHIAVTIDADSSVVSLYINGRLEATATADPPFSELPLNATDRIEIGNLLYTALDEIRIANTVRSPAWLEIQGKSQTNALLIQAQDTDCP